MPQGTALAAYSLTLHALQMALLLELPHVDDCSLCISCRVTAPPLESVPTEQLQKIHFEPANQADKQKMPFCEECYGCTHTLHVLVSQQTAFLTICACAILPSCPNCTCYNHRTCSTCTTRSTFLTARLRMKGALHPIGSSWQQQTTPAAARPS